MYQRVLLVIAVVFATLALSGCGKIVEEITYGEFVASPIPFACTEDNDCKLTDELYDPCGSVYAIHYEIPQSSIDEYNDTQMTLAEGIDYDCDAPPSIHEYVSLCRNQVCTSSKIQ